MPGLMKFSLYHAPATWTGGYGNSCSILTGIRFANWFLFLKDSEIFSAGTREIITPELIEVVYSIPVTIAEVNRLPCVVPGTCTDHMLDDDSPS